MGMSDLIKSICPLKEPCPTGKKGLCCRQECEVIYKCATCGWTGMLKDAVHTYHDDGSGEDVEPVDECPSCGMEDIEQSEEYSKSGENHAV